jgi:hypothetical protein
MSVTYPFVQAKWFTRDGMREPRGLIWHMAEGWSTVGYFTTTTRNVSSHFVIERSGRIVQVVRFTDASHTQHVAIDDDDRDAADCGIYDEALGRAVVGPGWPDINRYLIGIEVEGFRVDGPNAAQVASIVALYRDLRGRLPTLIGNLGHRDVQDQKSCPGCKFPWSQIDGHGLFGKATTEGPVLDHVITGTTTGQVRVLTGNLWRISDGELVKVPAGYVRNVVATITLAAPLPGFTGDEFRKGYLVTYSSGVPHFVLDKDVDYTPPAPVVVDCSTEVAEAVAADRARARIVYS